MTESNAADWERARQALGPDDALPVPGYLARGLAFAIDLSLMAGFVLLVEFVIGLVLLALAGADVIPRTPQTAWWIQPALEVYDWPIVVAIERGVDVLALAYLPWFWARGGQTPAMTFLKMRVARQDTGGELGFKVAIVRFLALAVSIVSIVGILWAFVDSKRRGWHDIVAGTVVIAE